MGVLFLVSQHTFTSGLNQENEMKNSYMNRHFSGLDLIIEQHLRVG